ncbi:hypothetical protein JCM33374_g1573 [Metschnikowia sp. JCM 33374]|nr:hypothetical protein JCM33374_g1573 [Metschnikowia sp. JCM 33374]
MTPTPSIIVIDFRLVFIWLTHCTPPDQNEPPSLNTAELYSQFESIYNDVCLTDDKTNDTIEQTRSLKRYQIEWQNFCIQGIKRLPPIPEAHFTKILFLAMIDGQVHEQLKKYGKPFAETKQYIRAMRETKKLFHLKVDEEFSYLHKIFIPSFPNSMVELFIRVNEKRLEAIGNGDFKTAKRYLNFAHSVIYFSWNSEKKAVFNSFYNDPLNSSIMKTWAENKLDEFENPNPLIFPSEPPNGLTEDSMKAFAGYYLSDTFERNNSFLKSLKGCFDPTTPEIL